MRRSIPILIFSLTGLAFAVACSSASDNKVLPSGNSTGGTGGSTGTAGTTGIPVGGSSGNAPGLGGSNTTGGSGGGIGSMGSSGTGGKGCASESYDGQRVPLDAMIMLDRSGSMQGEKWKSVVAAMGEFVDSPESEGMSIAAHVFPDPSIGDIPTSLTCSSDAECGNFAPCDVPFPGFPGFCTGEPECNASLYANPAIKFSLLPGAGATLKAGLANTKPSGGTPTTPALQGAVSYASDWAKQNPTHVVVVVLATDGVPSGCSGNSVDNAAQVAANALSSAQGIKTFVIGVGSDLTSLDQIAKAGGTDKAYLVDAGTNTTKEFVDAMNVIRGQVACSFQIPKPAMGTPDYTKVNVELKTGSPAMTDTVPQVPSKDKCDMDGGWYYDDPNNPTQIELCEASCGKIQVTENKATVDVVLGCETIIKVPKLLVKSRC
jgi:uncharacterized protein YegL